MTLEQQLAQAKAALHQLRIGKSKVTVRYGDRTVVYAQADRNDLKQYIMELEAELGLTRRGGPFGVQFG